MKKRYIIALDEGTTSARAAVFDTVQNDFIRIVNHAFEQIYPQAGWVEHDPEKILTAQYAALNEAVESSQITMDEVYGVGITNQRETAVMWDSETGKPVYNAIVWQCRRTSAFCNQLVYDGYSEYIREKTGLKIDAYFSATKWKWILDNVPEAKTLAKQKRLLAGTMDTFLVWKLTGGARHVTDCSNASRTMLFNIHTLNWDEDLLRLFGIPREILPDIVRNDECVGDCEIGGVSVPICGIAGDQQSALFGQGCYRAGMAKNTYGTGCFILLNTGETIAVDSSDMLSTVAWNTREGVCYALEGSVFNAGSTVQWLRDELKLIPSAEESEECALRVPDTCGVYFVPAFTGLGAPYWDMSARGVIVGLTRGANRDHIVRAGLESMAYSTRDIIDAMRSGDGVTFGELRADGGASRNRFLMQFQADMLGVPILRPKITETTALGAVYFCGLGTGAFSSAREIHDKWSCECVFKPKSSRAAAQRKYEGWLRAVERSRHWAEV